MLMMSYMSELKYASVSVESSNNSVLKSKVNPSGKMCTSYYLYFYYLVKQSRVQVFNKKVNKNYEFASEITNKYQVKIKFMRMVLGTRAPWLVKC